jgi:hypothetical protein
MKKSIIVLFLFVSSFINAQDYKSIVAAADQFYSDSNYVESAIKYQAAFKIEAKNPGDLYNGSCSAALAGEKDLAFEWLNLAFKNGWMNIKHLKTDTDLTSLHESKKWDELLKEMQAAVDKKEANYDKPLQAILLTIFDDDQNIRNQYIQAQKDYGRQSKIVDSLGEIMIVKDSINLIKVCEILDKYGWVGSDKVGSQANQTLFLVIQHSDLAIQQKYLPMMREAVKNKKANSSSLALLEDRVAIREGRHQIYGSQIGYDNETKKSYVLPLEDPDNVDQRRASVGLGPLAEYVKKWDIVWNAEEYKKMLPLLEKH